MKEEHADDHMGDSEPASAVAVMSDEEAVDGDGMDDGVAESDVDMVDQELRSDGEAEISEVEAQDIDEDNLIICLASSSLDVEKSNRASILRNGLEIKVPPPTNPEDYMVFPDPEVGAILQKYDNEGEVSYLARLTDNRVDEVRNVFFFASTSSHFDLNGARPIAIFLLQSDLSTSCMISKQIEHVARCLCQLTPS